METSRGRLKHKYLENPLKILLKSHRKGVLNLNGSVKSNQIFNSECHGKFKLKRDDSFPNLTFREKTFKEGPKKSQLSVAVLKKSSDESKINGCIGKENDINLNLYSKERRMQIDSAMSWLQEQLVILLYHFCDIQCFINAININANLLVFFLSITE